MGSANQRGPWTRTPPGRSRLRVPRGTVERRIASVPMRCWTDWPAIQNPRLAGGTLRIRPSVPRGTRQALRVMIRCRAPLTSHSPSFKTSPLCFARWTLCSTWNVPWLLKWARKCWPIDCHASAILTMRSAPNYVVANHNRFALCCEQLRFS